MNEKLKDKKINRYAFLKDQEVHTLTSALKLFFRETSDLIPEEFFSKDFPITQADLERNLESLKAKLNELDEIPKATLKYLIRHLKK